MTPEEAERRIQQGHLNGQEILKAYWRWRLKLLFAAVVKATEPIWRGWAKLGR